MRTFVLILLVALGLYGAETEPSLWRYVDPGAKAMAGIRWSAIKDSPVGEWIERRWVGDLTMPGFEFANNVEEVLISATRSGQEGETPLLIAIRGKFELAKVREVLLKQGSKEQSFNGIPIFRKPRKPASEPAFALLSSRTILVGDAQTLFSTIERARVRGGDEGPGMAVFTQAQALAAKYDCWALMNEPGAMPNFLFASLASKTLSGDSDGFHAGMSAKNGLTIDLEMSQRTERSAKILMADLVRMVRIAAENPNGSSEAKALLQKLRITTERTSVFMTLRMNVEEAVASLHARTGPVVAAANPAEPLAPAEPPKKMVIRIEGLDDGPRVLPFNQ